MSGRQRHGTFETEVQVEMATTAEATTQLFLGSILLSKIP